ncbi:hypothetical protein Ancab_021924 [Ancistrocladus abbreviatus]
MAPAAGPALPSDRAPMRVPVEVVPPQAASAAAVASAVGVTPPVAEMVARDSILAWYRGEFAAANAIIDALCNHLTQLNNIGAVGGSSSEYEAVFTAIHRRRLNWIPVLQMQKYFSIADVALELRKVAAAKKALKDRCEGGGEGDVVGGEEVVNGEKQEVIQLEQPLKSETLEVLKGEDAIKCDENGDLKEVAYEDSPHSEITDTGSQEEQANFERVEICDNHENCGGRREQIKITKGFVAKEPVKGHMASECCERSQLYENTFTNSELCKLNDFVDEVRAAGQNGELLGETYILFNKQMKGNKREQIQLGVPVFGQIKDEATSAQKTNIEPMPALLQSVIHHLVQWQILPENRKPNGCIINFFDEGEYSQPYLKPPHLDQPFCTLLLSESTIAFGRTLMSDSEGNYKGQLVLSLKGGSLLVMRNNSADMARHVMCPSPTRRVSITFFRVRPDTDHSHSSVLAPLTQAMTLWQPRIPSPTTMPNGAPNGYEAMETVPKWGIIRSPVVMLAPVRPMVMNPRRMPRGGTGVFLPWTVGSRKPARRLPPRAQKGRFLALPSIETQVSDTMSDPGMEGPKMMGS